jgi:TPR repeat protein
MTAIENHPFETIAMPFLSRFGFGRSRQTEDLERRVAHLQAALRRHPEAAGRRAGLRRKAAGAIAVLMLGIGFTLGTYREPIQHAVIGLAQPLGFTRGATKSDALYTVYQHGRYVTAMRMARPLAAEGDARAQSMLGLLYYRGQGVPQDHNEALRWFRQAADQSDVAAQFHLGIMFAKGQGVPQDNAEAAKWFGRAADLGDAQAQYNLGLFYARGEAGEPDNVRAHMWFNLAAARFPPSDTDDRSAAARNRELVTRKMTPDQIAEAQRRAREWKPKST